MTNFDYSTNYSLNWKDNLKDGLIQKKSKSNFTFKDLVKITFNEGKALLEVKSSFPLLNQAHLKSFVVAVTHFEQKGDLLLKALLQDPCSASFILGNLNLHAEDAILNKILKTVSEQLTVFQKKPSLNVEEIQSLHQIGQLLSSDTLNDHEGVLFLKKELKELIIRKAPESTEAIEKIKKLKEGLLNKTIPVDEVGDFISEIDLKYQSLLLLSELDFILLIARTGQFDISSMREKIGITFKGNSLEDQITLIEIAKIAAVQNAKVISRDIKNYGIESQESLIEIAKIAAAQDGLAISVRIQNYGIKSQESLIEIAKIAAAQNAWGTSGYIAKYGIKSQEGLIEIAKIAADQNGTATSNYIQNYGIKSQESLIEIAKIAAAQDGEATALHIKNYGIKSQEGLIEIAKIAAAQNGGVTSQYIGNYGIKLQEGLIEIAKLAAAQNGGVTSQYIGNYGIKLQEGLIEIAKIAAAHDGEGTSERIDNYNLSEKDFWDIYVICLSSDLRSKISYEVNLSYSVLYDFLDKNVEDVTWHTVKKKVLPLLKQGYPSAYSMALDIMKKFNTEKQSKIPPASLIHSLKWLLIASVQQHGKELSHPMWKDILRYPDPQMRYRLLQSASAVLSNNSSYKTHPIAHMHLPDLLLTEMGIQSLQPLLGSKRIFRDGRALKVLLDTLVLLHKEGCSIQKVEQLMTDLPAQGKDIKTALELIQGVAGCKGLEELQCGEIEYLKTCFEKAFKTFVPIQSKNFAENFLRTFGNQREYTSLLVYAQRHKANREVLACLGEMIDSIFNNDYLQNRYQGVHLEAVFTLRPDLKDLWIPNLTFDLKKIFNGLTAQSERTNYYQFFHEKVVTDRHIDQAHYPLLVRYLQNKEECIPTESDEGSSLQLQQRVIEFLEKSPTLSLEEQKKSLIDMQKHFSIAVDAQKFVYDLQGLIDGLNKKKKNIDELQMFLTDDYWDLFCCGSEVAGSCLSLDGDRNFNKCLLAYVIDGKNKILEIKGNEGKICARAILRLLIDDSTKEPVLFLEGTYANPGIDRHLQDALKAGAKELAKQWNLSLYISGPSAVKLISLGSSAPWEYVDSNIGVHAKGKFTITTAQLVK